MGIVAKSKHIAEKVVAHVPIVSMKLCPKEDNA